MNRDHPNYRTGPPAQFWAACKRTQIDRTLKGWGARGWALAHGLGYAGDNGEVLRMVVQWDRPGPEGLSTWGYAHYVDGALYAPVGETHRAADAAGAVQAVLRARAQRRLARALRSVDAAQDELARADAAGPPADEG